MLSRAFGDWELKSYGVSNEPHITRINITDNDKYVVVATDGIWDVLSNEDVVNLFQMTPYYYKTGRKDQQKLAGVSNLHVTFSFAVFLYGKEQGS